MKKAKYTLLYDPTPKLISAGLFNSVKVIKKKCECICHRLKGVRHMDMCCIDGYVWEVTIEKS